VFKEKLQIFPDEYIESIELNRKLISSIGFYILNTYWDYAAAEEETKQFAILYKQGMQ